MPKECSGFSIIELLVVLTIGAILASMAVPSFSSFLNNTRMSSAANLLVSDLNLARSEAIKRNSRMLLCTRDSAGTACATGTNWQSGWIVCFDGDSNNACDTTSTSNPNPVVVRNAMAGTLTLTGSANMVVFNPNASAVAATLTLAGTWSGATSRVISVAATGNISSQ